MEKLATSSATKALPTFLKFYKQQVHNILAATSGACIVIHEDGDTVQYGDIDAALKIQLTVLDQSLYKDFVMGGSIGVAEAFIEGKWTTDNLPELIKLFAINKQQLDAIEEQVGLFSKIKRKAYAWVTQNTVSGSKKNILAHYDLGNELYRHFLDDSMMYSSAVYPNEDASLAQAQQYKLQQICEKLDLQPGENVVEIGTGWGGFAIYAAKHYDVHVTTTTISDAQYEWAKQRIEKEGLSDKITLLNKDYRSLVGQFDKLVSIEMIEAVGHKYFPTFFNVCQQLLKPSGKMLIQAITINDQQYKDYLKGTDFIQRYIFPGGCLPAISELSKQVAEQTRGTIERIDDIGLDYAKTLSHWRENFLQNWDTIATYGFDERFKRLWLYYFGYCEGAFLARHTSTIHLLIRT
ncbi:SAM-dependent methyltransferase [Thalassotalea agarivorans]|uniref:Cyclopropane-fatty-acyl-phospholipid synthase n=1 Tax=Thalassotalea agarivorans TaxID=349064 RepID=A0A1H9Y4W2_THASX|nr:cyclopropane-fatty-acyl-phospholipid synthase [Thalassotalea agarivorans]